MKYMPAPKKLLLLILILLPINSIGKQYIIDESQTLEYSGYLGYRYLFTDNPISSTFDHQGHPEIGLNLTYKRDDLEIFNQFRYGEDSGTYLVYNFLQYSFHLHDNMNLIVRGGKLRHEFGLYNTTRVNPNTRQGIIQPQSIYWNVFDEFLTSGVGVQSLLQFNDFEISYTIADPTIIDNEKLTRSFYGPLLYKTDSGFGNQQVVSAKYSPLALPLVTKFSWMHSEFGANATPIMQYIRPQLINKNITADAITFGVEYTAFDHLTLSGETLWFRPLDYSWTKDHELITKGFSLTGVYRLTDNLDVRLNYNEYNAVLNSQLRMKPWLSYYKDLNVGVNYHVDDWTFQVEGHTIQGSRILDPKEVAKNPDAYEDWWMIATSIVYSF